MSCLRKKRNEKGLTQQQAAEILGVSLRSYKSYENDSSKVGSLKHVYMLETLDKYIPIDETHGILSLNGIKQACKTVFCEYPVRYCFLFGSYAKGTAGESSDVDLLVSADVTGLRFFGMAERLRNELRKNVDLLDIKQLAGNCELIDEILRDGIKVYEQSEN